MTTREASRANNGTDYPLATDTINTGSLQRIADAVEKMAGNFTFLQNDRDYYKSKSTAQAARIERLTRSISSLKGVITKLRDRGGK